MLADTWAAAAVPHHALSGLPLALLLLLLPGLCSCSCSDSAPNSFPGQILTTSPLRATTTCSCEDSPSGFSAGCSPSGLPGSRSTFPSSLPSLVDFDLFSSVFPLLTRGHIPGLQTGHKGFHMCRTEEGAVGLFLSVLLRGYPAVGTQQTWACPVRGQRGEQWGMLRAAPGCQVPSSVFLGWHRFCCWGYTCRWCWGGSRFPVQRFFFSCFLSEQRADHHKELKPVPGGLCVISFAWPCPLDVKATNTSLLMCMRRERDGISGPAATLSFSPGAAHQTCRQAAWRVPVWHRGKEEVWCWRGHRDQC